MILIQMVRNRFLFILFLILLFSLSLNSFASNNHRTPLIETINSSNKLEYSGYYINKSSKKITKLSIRFIAKNKYGEILEANTIRLINNSSMPLGPGEKLYYSFMIDSDPKNIYTKKLYFFNE